MERAAAGPKEASFSVTSTQDYALNTRVSEEEERHVGTQAGNKFADVPTEGGVPCTYIEHAQPVKDSPAHNDLHQHVLR